MLRTRGSSSTCGGYCRSAALITEFTEEQAAYDAAGTEYAVVEGEYVRRAWSFPTVKAAMKRLAGHEELEVDVHVRVIERGQGRPVDVEVELVAEDGYKMEILLAENGTRLAQPPKREPGIVLFDLDGRKVVPDYRRQKAGWFRQDPNDAYAQLGSWRAVDRQLAAARAAEKPESWRLRHGAELEEETTVTLGAHAAFARPSSGGVVSGYVAAVRDIGPIGRGEHAARVDVVTREGGHQMLGLPIIAH